MTGSIKLFPRSTTNRFLEATKFSKYVPFGFDSKRQLSTNIGIPDKRLSLKGIFMDFFFPLFPSLENRMGNL